MSENSLEEIGHLEWLRRRAQAERDEHIRPEIQALVARGDVTPAELATLRCNSWEWEALVPAMNDDALTEQFLSACCVRSKRPFATYNESIVGLFAPELLKRFDVTCRADAILHLVFEALGKTGPRRSFTHVADDVKELVEAIESRCDALVVLKRIRGR